MLLLLERDELSLDDELERFAGRIELGFLEELEVRGLLVCVSVNLTLRSSLGRESVVERRRRSKERWLLRPRSPGSVVRRDPLVDDEAAGADELRRAARFAD